MSDEDATEGSAGGFSLSRERQLRPDIDPEAQNIITSARPAEDGLTPLRERRAGGVVEVLAQLRQPGGEVQGLRVSQRVGDIVTGTVEVGELEAVLADPNVIRLEVARKLYRTLERSVYEIRAGREQLREHLPETAVPFDGRNVVVGVIDHGCDFVHQNFRVVPDGATTAETRIIFLWDQHGEPPENPPEGSPPFGREFDSRAINLALMEEHKSETAPYDFLGYTPEPRAHGTSVLDVAAGNGRTTCARGVAPGAAIIFVDSATDDPRSTESLGNSRVLADAVKYVFDKADGAGKPAVINISLNGRDGPHDGSTLVERWMDRLLETEGRAIVIASGNWRDELGHAAGRLESQKGRTLKWLIPEGDETDNELEIWYDSDISIGMSLRSPDGALSASAPFGQVTRIYSNQEEVGRISHGESYTDNGAKRIAIFLSPRVPAGEWDLALESNGVHPVVFHAWIAGDPGGQSTFGADADPLFTVGTISCGESTIVVGSYNPLKPHRPASSTSSGPTRDDKKKPEVSAPGVRIRTARARAKDTIESSGTSLAAPHVAGAVALMMQAVGEMLPVERLREALLAHARRSPPEGQNWSPVYGNGRVDALASALSLVRE